MGHSLFFLAPGPIYMLSYNFSPFPTYSAFTYLVPPLWSTQISFPWGSISGLYSTISSHMLAQNISPT